MNPVPRVSFIEAVKLYFTRAFDFKGRARRSEYWWVCLFNFVVGFGIGLIIPDLSWIWTVISFVPTLSLCARRLHDTGRSAWWYLLIFVPLVGSILLIVWFCQDSVPENQWGASTKYLYAPDPKYIYQ